MLPNEILAVILKYLNYVDILSIKFLSKRCFNITFLNTRFKYFRGLAKQLTDCNLYYQEINAFIDNFVQKIKSDISLPDWVYLNYFFDQLKGNLMLSSCFCHLFHCPRSFYAPNNCPLCSKKIPNSTWSFLEVDQLFNVCCDFDSEKLSLRFCNFIISRIPDIVAKFDFNVFKSIDHFRFRLYQREAIENLYHI